MSLVNELIKDLLPEQENKTVAIYAGGFKPPTKGHYAVVEQALEEHPDIDEFLIYVGKKERDDVTQAQSILIWDIYKKYLPMKVKIVPLSIPPIKAVYDYAKENPNTNVLWVLGARDGNEDDFGDIASRTKNAEKYDNLALAVTVTQGTVSGTAARGAANVSIEKLIPFLPEELSNEEMADVYNILKNKLSEGRKKKKDPKKGTGKKPEGSSRRLYTDEDPKDTIGVKFSTRQDIVNTLNKKSFKAKSHARQSQIINLIHQRVRAALARTKDPKKKAKLKSGFEYITKRKEASKKKTQRLKKQKLKEFYYIKEQKIPYTKNKVKFGFTSDSGLNYITEFIRDDEVKNDWHFNFGIKNNKKIDYNSTTNRGEIYPVMETIADIIFEFLDKNTKLFNLIMKSSSTVNKQNDGLQEDKSQRQRRLLFTKFIKEYPVIYENKLSINSQNALVWNIREKEGQDLKIIDEKLCKRGKAYIAKRKREGEKHNPFLAGRAVKVCKGQIKGSDGKKKKDFRPKKGKTRSAQGRKPDIVKEKKGFGKSAGYRYRAIYKKGDKYYYMQDNPFSPGIRQEFGPFKTREAAKRKMQSFPPGTSYRDIKEIGINLSNYSGQILPGDVLRAPKGFPLGGKKLEKSLQLKVIKNSREGVNRYKLSLEDKDGKKYTVRNFQMDGEYKGKKLPKWGLVRKSKKNINENATYSNKIDYKKLIKDFTKHMIKIGKNIQPLPRVIFKHSDSDNASNFFGRTAYYDPNNQTIVLYTEGRHPKDIVRSFAHEMVHHTQYLEDRLGNVQTTNTNADANLDRIEREAYLDGNMVFRNWTDSIDGEIVTSINEKKKKTKDPFGLNAFAYELAMLREDNKDYYIYLDMDGVVANFDKRFEDLSGMTPSQFISKYDKNAFWNLIDEKHKIAFWRGIEVMPGADRLVNFVAQYPYEMLTAPSAKKQSVIGKSLWIKDKVGTLYSSQPKVTYKRAKEKHLVKPNLTKFDILIDDKPSTIDNWNNAGGTGIFYQSASQVINDLKKLGL